MSNNNDEAICIPLDPEVLAGLLDKNSTDWSAVLDFLNEYATSQGFYLDYDKVIAIMEAKYHEVEYDDNPDLEQF